MELKLGPEDAAFRDEVREFIDANLPADIRRRVEGEKLLPKSDYVRWQKILHEKGWIAAHWPVEHGGTEWSPLRRHIFDEVLGQEALLGPGTALRSLAEGGALPSLLLWGPPGCGKTTLAQLLAARSGMHLATLSAVQAGVKEIRAAVERADHRCVHAQSVILDVGERLVVFARRLQRCVGRPVREVEEEGSILVGLDHLHGLVGVVVGQVLRRLEGVASVERRRELECAP